MVPKALPFDPYQAHKTKFEAHCEDMRMWAVEQELERLQKDMVKDRLQMKVQKVKAKLQEKTIELMSLRLDRILGAVK